MSTAPQPVKPARAKSLLQSLRPFLWRWHKRAGLLAALVVVLVTLTGIALNHTSELQLGKHSVRQAWLLQHYGIALPKLHSFQVDGHWLSGDDQQYLYLDQRQVAYCNGRLIGAAVSEGLILLACEQELLLLTQEGEVVERLGASYGLPVPLEAVAPCGEQLCLLAGGGWMRADFQQLVWTPLAGAEVKEVGKRTIAPRQLPAQIREPLMREQIGTALSWERVLLDLHSGRILGYTGVLIVDAAALLLLFLALSGFLLWYQARHRRGR